MLGSGSIGLVALGDVAGRSKGKLMYYGECRCLRPALVLTVALLASIYSTSHAKESSASVNDAEQYLAKGDAKAAEIELRNAIRESPEDPVLRARLAEVYLLLGDAVAAEREARAARERNGDEADYLLVLADALLRQQKFAEIVNSVPIGDRSPALESKVRTVWGTAEAALRDRDKANTMFRDAIRLDPTAVEPKIQLAQFLAASKPEEAENLIDEAIAANPRSIEALQTKGEMLRQRGDAGGAVHFFDEALNIDPKNVTARLNRAYVNIGQGKFAAADEDLDPILQSTPNNFMANYLRALELTDKQQFTAADQIFDRISPRFERFWTGYYAQGATKLALGQSAQAEIILRKYLSRFSDDPRASQLVATAALRQRAPSRAIDYLNPLVDKSSANAAILTLLGNAYMADGKPELALQQFKRAAELDPEDPATKTRVALSEINAGHRQQGLSELEQVFASAAGAVTAGPSLVLTDLRDGRVNEAAEVAASLVQRDADNPLYQTLLGEVRAAQHDYPVAETAYRAALARDAGFTAAARDLALLYQATGRSADAEKMYNELLSKKPDDVAALLGLADIAIAQEKWSDATDLLNRARAASKLDPTPGLKLVGLYELRRDWNSAKALAAELGEQFLKDMNVLKALGRAQAAVGDVNGAISSYKRAYQLAPTSTAILSSYVALLREAKYFRQAWDVLREAVARDPRNASMKAELVRVYAEVDGVDSAVAKAREFANDDPDNTLYDRVSAEIYEKAGRVGAAVALLEQALAAHPLDGDVPIALSQLYRRTGELVKAEGVLTARLQTDPKDLAAISALAPLYLMTGRAADARKGYNEVLSQRPNDVTALLSLADIAVAQKKWAEASDHISRARAAAPDEPRPGLALVNLCLLRQDWKSAIATATALVAKFPGNVDVVDALGRSQIAAGNTNAAVSTYKSAHATAPNSRPILSRYIDLLNAEKNFGEAQKVLQEALDRDPGNALAKTEMIRALAESDGLDAGLAKARSFSQADPNNSAYDVVSAELYEKAGRGGEAVGLLEKALGAHPSDGDLTITLARLYARSGVPAKAEAVLKGRLKADPKDYVVRSALALFYLEQKRYVASTAEYSRVIDDHPIDPAALNNLAGLYQRQGELAKARELAERAFSMTARAPWIGDTLGWILLAQGDADRALPYLSSANLLDPGDPDIQYHLAVALHRVGRAADARALLEGLLGSKASFADKPDAEQLLQELKRG